MPRRHERMQAGDIEVDCATRRVTVRGESVALAGKEYELLVKLASDPTRVFTKEQLLRDVWGFRSLGRTRTLDSHASRLRRKLARPGAGPFLVNLWGVGQRVARGGGTWREVASLRGSRRLGVVAKPMLS